MFETINIWDIVPFEPWRNHTYYQELKESLQDEGLLNPPTVRITEDGRYQVISGEWRVIAWALLGNTEITVQVYEMSDSELQQFHLLENVHNVTPTEAEYGDMVKRMRNAYP